VLIRAFIVAVAIALLAPGSAHAFGFFGIDGTTVTFRDSDDAADNIAIFVTGSTIRLTSFGDAGIGPDPGCTFSGPETVDCPLAGVNLIVLRLGPGDDVAAVSGDVKVTTVFNGEDGNDGLFGGGGVDIFHGGNGNDNVVSRDGVAEQQVDCGTGNDTAISDDSDTRIGCEEWEGDADLDGVRVPADCNDANAAIRPGATDVPDNGVDENCDGVDATNLDRDRDGVPRPQDCNDANAAIRPGATDVPDNGVDENCDGVDATNLDRDRDGVPRPQDCNDANAAIRPGATEIIGNDVDENCDGLVAPYPPLTGSVSGTWQQVGKGTRNLTLVAKGFPFRTVITLRCTGSPACPKTIKKTVGRDRRAVNLHAALGRRTLSKKARITLSITRASRIGRELRYSLATPGLPDMEFLCRPPGGSAGPC
jgi:putative metal-binding protein